MLSTPTKAMKALLGIEPIIVVLRANAFRTMHRLWRSKMWTDKGDCGRLSRNNHIKICRTIRTRLPITFWPCDFRKTRPLIEGKFKGLVRSLVNWLFDGLSNLNLDNNRQVFIYSDSLSALMALLTWNYMSLLVAKCFQALNTLSEKPPVVLSWIPAYNGFSGNEKADELAKLAASIIVNGL